MSSPAASFSTTALRGLPLGQARVPALSLGSKAVLQRQLQLLCSLSGTRGLPDAGGVVRCCASSAVEAKATSNRGVAGSTSEQLLFRVEAQEYGDGVRYRHIIRSKNHLIHGDLGPEYGGSDFGPSPKELVLSGLAMDASLTVRMFADKKGWPLRTVRVDVKEHGRGRGQIPEGLEVIVFLDGDLTREQKSALLTVAGKCPMKNLLLGKMSKGISTRLGLKMEKNRPRVDEVEDDI